MTASTISFEVTEDGKVHSVVMIDQVTRVRISKLDITDQREVSGAHLEILDEKGEILESWVSGNEPHYVEKLPVGTYHLRETLAPEGYEKTEDGQIINIPKPMPWGGLTLVRPIADFRVGVQVYARTTLYQRGGHSLEVMDRTFPEGIG